MIFSYLIADMGIACLLKWHYLFYGSDMKGLAEFHQAGEQMFPTLVI